MDFMSKDFDLAENVFYFLNSELKSMAFVLDWDTNEKFYSNLLTMNFADVLDTQNDHAMVLAIPEETKYFHSKIPAFNINYIQDCFNKKDFPDPTKYLIKHTSPASYTKKQLIDCLGHQTTSWSDLVPISRNESSSDDSDDIMASSDTTGFISENFSDDSDDIIAPCDTNGFISKNTRMPYSHKEEKSIVKYIIKNNYAFDVLGVKMWKDMEHDNVCKRRTWQSMKQRYLKFIKRQLYSGNQSYSFISSEDLKLLRQGLNIDKMGKIDRIAVKSSINKKRIEALESTDSS